MLKMLNFDSQKCLEFGVTVCRLLLLGLENYCNRMFFFFFWFKLLVDK